ncbi:hypothetical protein GCM10009079_22070 [Ralstonia mannitolilytica]
MGFLKWLCATLAVVASSFSFAAQDEKVWDVLAAKDSAGNVRRIIRHRSEMPSWVQRRSFGALVVISWPNADHAGMPTKRELNCTTRLKMGCRLRKSATEQVCLPQW